MRHHRRLLRSSVVCLWAGWMCLHPAGAVSLTSLAFSEVVEEAALVMEGTVVELRVVASGSRLATAPERKSHRAPAAAAARPEGATAAPQAVGVEGGRMLFTEVTLAVDREIVGEAGSTVTFRVAGGVDGNEEVRVFGMPRFELGGRYVVFLRPGFADTGVPIVGVHQGFFEVAAAENGEEVLLNADGDVVVAVEDDRVVCRRNPQRAAGPAPRLGPAPVPEQGSGVRAATSAAVARYWGTEEPPLELEDFVTAIHNAEENLP